MFSVLVKKINNISECQWKSFSINFIRILLWWISSIVDWNSNLSGKLVADWLYHFEGSSWSCQVEVVCNLYILQASNIFVHCSFFVGFVHVCRLRPRFNWMSVAKILLLFRGLSILFRYLKYSFSPALIHTIFSNLKNWSQFLLQIECLAKAHWRFVCLQFKQYCMHLSALNWRP